MYESPIDIIYTDIQYKVVEEFDKNVVSAVQSYGIDVNKEELIKALRYDRQQYEKGYADAKSERRWIPCSERLPEATDGEYLCSVLDFEKEPIVYCLRYCNEPDDPDVDGWWYDGCFEDRCDQKDITAWMPLPEPYKE